MLLPTLYDENFEETADVCVSNQTGLEAALAAAQMSTSNETVHIFLCPETKDTPLVLTSNIELTAPTFNITLTCSELSPTGVSIGSSRRRGDNDVSVPDRDGRFSRPDRPGFSRPNRPRGGFTPIDIRRPRFLRGVVHLG